VVGNQNHWPPTTYEAVLLLLADLIQLGSRTAGTLGLRSIANDLAVGLDVLVDVPVINAHSMNNLFHSERSGWELECVDE